MKARNESVVVQRDEKKVPVSLVWRGRLYRITHIEDRWRLCSKWWIDGKGYRRNYFRVTARSVGTGQILTADLFQQAGNWILESECD